MAGEAKLRIVADNQASATIAAVKGSLDSLRVSIGALAGASGVGALVAGVTSTLRAMDDIADAAEGLGVTATALANMRLAASQAGVGAAQLDSALGRLNVQIANAVAGNREAVRYFSDLGIAFKESDGSARSTMAVLRDMAKVFSTSADGAGKTALAMEGLGDAGRRMVPYLNQGVEGLEKFAGLSDKGVEAARRLQGEIDKASAAWQRFWFSMTGAAAQAFNALNDVAGRQDTSRQIETLTKRIATLQQQLQHQRNPDFLQAINIELAETQAILERLQRLGMDRFISGANAARRVDTQQLKRTLVDASSAVGSQTKREIGVGAGSEGRAGEMEASLAMMRRAEDEAKRLDALLGRSRLKDLRADLERLDKAFFDGAIHAGEYDAATARLLGNMDELSRQAKDQADAFSDVGLVFESALSKLITGAEEITARSFLKSLADDIAQVTLKVLVLEPLLARLRAALQALSSGSGGGLAGIFAAIGGAFGGARADGGPVASGRPYLVGERGPEIFVPNVSGQVLPNGVAGGVSVTQQISISGNASPSQVRAIIAQSKHEAVREIGNQLARRGPVTRI